jgi:hypothetical protein
MSLSEDDNTADWSLNLSAASAPANSIFGERVVRETIQPPLAGLG